MNNDDELRQMFDATRRVDAKLAPAFDSLAATIPGPSTKNVRQPDTSSIAARIVVMVAALAIAIAFAAVFPRDNETATPNIASTQSLDQICDALIVRLNDADTTAQPDLHEMTWTTSSDSLLPIATFSFGERKKR